MQTLTTPQELANEIACEIRQRWKVVDTLAIRAALILLGAPSWVGRGATIVSGFRSRAKQAELEQEGRPTAPFNRSTHTSCPATGLDFSLGAMPSRQAIRRFGVLVEAVGLRWGGGSPVGEDGIPSDWNHVDLGPRS